LYNHKKLSITQALFFLIFSLVLNGFGNGLTVATNMGSSVWTASAANLSDFLSMDIGKILIIYGFLQIIINAILL